MTKSKSVFYDLQEPVKDDFNYIGDSVEDQLRKRAADLFNDGILGLSSFEITVDPGSNNQTVKFSVGPGVAYVGNRRVEILSDDTTTYNELNPAKNLLNGECPKSTGCKDVTVSISSGNDCVTVFLLYAKDYDENVYIIDPETYGKRYTRERSGYAIGYAIGTRDDRPILPEQFNTGGVWVNYRENPSDPATNWTVGYSYIIIADLLYTGSEWVVDRARCQRIILREEVQPSEEVEKHQITHHTNGISSLTETNFKYYKYAVKDLLGEGSFRTVSTPISLTYTSPITTTEIYIRIAVNNATSQDLTITIYDTDDTEIDHKTFTFTSSVSIVTYSYMSTTPFTVGRVSVSSTGSNITVNYKIVNGVDTPKTHTIYRDTTDTDTYDEYLPFAIPQLDNNGINQSDCIMIRDTLTENKSFIYVNGKRITRFLFRGIELSSVQWVDNKKYFVLKNLTQTDFGGQTGTFYLVVDENGSIGFSTSLDPLKLTLAVLNVSYYTDNDWLPGSVGGLAIDLADNRHLVDSHKKLRLTSYPIEIVPTKDVSDQVEIQLSANTSPLTNIPLLPLKINIVRDSNDPTKSKLVFIGSTGNNILTILDNGNVGIGTTNPTNFKLQIDGNTGPNIDNTYDLGSTNYRWKSLYLGGGSLNIDQIGGTNYERLNIGYDTNNNRFQILTTTSGTGTLRPLYLTTGTNNGITIDTSGNVGIGTTTPSQKLTVNGKLQIGDDSSPPIAGTIKWNGSNFLGYNGTVWLTLDAQPTSAAGWTSDTGRVYLTTASDYVGIGIITYPQEKLVLSQGSNFAVEMSVPTEVTASTSSGGTLNGTYYYKISASDGIGWTTLSSEVSATVDGGTTAGTINVSWSAVTGAVKYRVWRGTSSNGEDAYYETTSTSIADNGSLTFTSGTPPTATTAYVNKISASGNSWILGNVGIGTSLPGNKFGITITSDDTIPALGSNGGSFALLRKVNNNPGNYGFLMGVLSSGNVFQQVQRIDGTATPYSLLLQPNGGNVGIGITSTPSTRLEVNGDIKVSGGTLNVQGKVKEYGYDLLPRGVIVMWSGSIASIPPGWALCDGGTYTAPDGTQVTTPNLKDKFIVGAGGEYSVGATGGEKYHTLTVAEIPSHYHVVDPPATQTTTNGDHTHSVDLKGVGRFGGGEGTWGSGESRDTSTAGAHSHTVDIPAFNSGSTGGGQPHENRPPYYALAFIMKL
jgi:microcystin-dependent protein